MSTSQPIARGRAAIAVLTATVLAGMGALVAPARAVATAGPPSPAGITPVAGSAVPFATAAAARGLVNGARQLTVQVWLAPRSAAADAYATAVSTPGSGRFGKFLSPSQYAARFGASAGQAGAVEAWLRSAGFSGVTADTGRSYVRATAPVSVIDRGLGTRLRYYRAPSPATAGPHELHANDGPVSVPASVAGDVLGITGLDNAPPASTWSRAGGLATPPGRATPRTPRGMSGQPASLPDMQRGGGMAAPADAGPADPSFPCSAWYGQHLASGLPRMYGATEFPTQICGYSAAQLRHAYGYSPAYTGRGQTIAVVELGLVPYMFRTLTDYAQANGITLPAAADYRELALGSGPGCGTPFDVEEQMDVEAAYAMAPGAAHLVVGGDSCDNGDYGLQALFNADNAVLDGHGDAPLASVVSNSWEGFSENQPSQIDVIEHALLVRAAVEGVGMYFSSGDASGVLTPSSDPYAISVGGTTLGIGATASRLFETGWSSGMYTDSTGAWDFQGENGGAGGGPSLLWAQPAYQRAFVPAALAGAPGDRGGLVRTVPDISADGDPFTGMAVGTLAVNSAGHPVGYSQAPTGGTSLATPLIAGLVADAQQGMPRAFGFLNPVLYRLAGTRAFYQPQPVTGQTPGKYRAVACSVSACGVLSLVSFDDQSWTMAGYTGQVSRAGYSTMTGIGVPNAGHFLPLLRALERSAAPRAARQSAGRRQGMAPGAGRQPRAASV
jgi:subtilase family serine protease